MTRPDPTRRSDLAAIHIAQAQLGLADADYRAMLERITGRRSAAQLTRSKRRDVLAELGRLGWSRTPARRAGRNRLADSGQARLARALWIRLRQAGAIGNSSEAALDRFVERMTDVSSVRFATIEQLQIVIEALKSWLERVDPDALMDEDSARASR